jgi:hypothetical protein
MLYALRHRSDALSGATARRGAQWDSEENNRNDRCCNIVWTRLEGTMGGGREAGAL